MLTLLVSVLLPLAHSPAQAQSADLAEIAKFFGTSITKTTPIVMLDFENLSAHKTGMPGRMLADALSMELEGSRVFEVVKRQQTQAILDEFGLNIPLSVDAQALVADRLKAPYTVTGTIDSINIVHSKRGTYAEVAVTTIVMSRVLRLAINGTKITQKSSPKLSYSGGDDVLVQEALSTAAYQISQRLLDNRLPIATVIISPRTHEVLLRGGSTIGLKRGMEMITVRRESVTGRLSLTTVNPNDSEARVLEDSKGIAPGDKAVPIFKFGAVVSDAKAFRDSMGLKLVGLAMLGGLAMLAGTNNGDASYTDVSAPVVAPLADAVDMGHPFGANYLRLPSSGDRLVATLIYRDTDTRIPIAVVDSNTAYYLDTANPLPQPDSMYEESQVDIDLNPDTGLVETFTWSTDYIDADTTLDSDMEVGMDTFSCTAYRKPLAPGESTGYMIRQLYITMDPAFSDPELGLPEEYMFSLSLPSSVSPRVILTAPPTLESPADGTMPIDGNYRCQVVPRASNYKLQLSDDPSFPPGHVEEDDKAQPDGDYVLGSFPMDLLYSSDKLKNATVIYWRMGAKVSGNFPAPVALQDHNKNGYVYSDHYSFVLPETPPATSRSMRIWRANSGMPMNKVPPSGRAGGRGILHRSH